MSLLKTYRPSGLAAFSLTTPLFGVLATALVIGEPIGWRLAISALLVAGGIAAATLFRDRAVVARAVAARPVPGGTR
jgi:drug/metabolite transporter (DMT)-like permease